MEIGDTAKVEGSLTCKMSVLGAVLHGCLRPFKLPSQLLISEWMLGMLTGGYHFTQRPSPLGM